MTTDAGASHAKTIVSPHSGADVPSTGQTPDTFLTAANTLLEKAVAEINHVLDKTVNWVNDHLDELAEDGGGIGGILGGIAMGPVGGILGGIAGHKASEHAAAAIQAKLDAAFHRVNTEWQTEVEPDIRKAIGLILGDPLKMSAVASAYRDAVTVLGTVQNVMANSVFYGGQFEGLAGGAYGVVQGEQVAALTGIQASLADAATEMDNQEKTLLDYWTQQLANIANFIGDMTDVADEASDLAKIALADIGPITQFFGTLSKGAGDILAAWMEDVTQSATTGAGFWDGQIATLGSNGLPGGQWPRIGSRQLDDLNSNTWESK